MTSVLLLLLFVRFGAMPAVQGVLLTYFRVAHATYLQQTSSRSEDTPEMNYPALSSSKGGS